MSSEPRHGWKVETEMVVEVPPGRQECIGIVGHDGPGQRKAHFAMQWRRGGDGGAPFVSKGEQPVVLTKEVVDFKQQST